MKERKGFGARLYALRVRNGLTQAELAKRSGVSVTAIARWERGIRTPGWDSVEALAKAFGVTAAEFEQAEPRSKIRAGRPPKPHPA